MKNEGTEAHYPKLFVCAFCKQEFELIGSLFEHMKEMHNSMHKGDE